MLDSSGSPQSRTLRDTGLVPHGCSEAGMAEERTKTILVDRRADEAIFVVYAVVHLVQETLWCTYRDGDAL